MPPHSGHFITPENTLGSCVTVENGISEATAKETVSIFVQIPIPYVGKIAVSYTHLDVYKRQEMTAPTVSVGADTEQPIKTCTDHSISDYNENIKSFEEMQREMLRQLSPSYLKTCLLYTSRCV